MLPCQTGGTCPCHALSQAVNELAATKSLVERLTLDICRLKAGVNASHDPLVNRLPRELASRIFTFCLPSTTNQRSNPYRYSTDYSTANTLGSVCTAWRYIAWSTPQRWNVISIQLHSAHRASILQHIETYHSRSGALPLTIRIHTHRHENLSKFASEMFYPIIDALNLHSHRWQSLEMCIPFSLTSMLHGSHTSGAPQLKNLTIHTDSRFIGPRSRIGFGTHQQLIRPATVNLRGLCLKAVRIDWGHVVQVDVEALRVNECLELLRLAPTLTVFKIDVVLDDDENADESTSLVTHHSLKALQFPFWGPSLILCDRLVLPALESLWVSWGGLHHSHIEGLLTRSACRLLHFCITDAECTTQILVTLLRLMPHLENLKIMGLTNHSGINELCVVLARTSAFPANSNHSALFLPRLKTFHCNGQGPVWAIVPSLFPPANKEPHVHYRPLSTVHFEVDDDPSQENGYIDHDIIPKLLDVVDRGFDLKVACIFEEGEDFIEASRQHHNLLDRKADPNVEDHGEGI